MAESAPSPAENPSEAGYTSTDLKHLSDREHVRERFGMYIGDNTSRGLHHLVYEVVDNSIDECMAEYAYRVSVTVNVDGSVTVEDDGRGILQGFMSNSQKRWIEKYRPSRCDDSSQIWRKI
jgi:DNA gyrase subunit B